MSVNSRARGMTLIETLVAMLVFGFGLAGIAALLVLGLRAGREAALEAEAVAHLAAIAEELRALAGGDAAPLAVLAGSSAAEACAAVPARCAREQAAALALARWQADLQRELGTAASLALEPPVDGATAWRVELGWRDRRDGARWLRSSIAP